MGVSGLGDCEATNKASRPHARRRQFNGPLEARTQSNKRAQKRGRRANTHERIHWIARSFQHIPAMANATNYIIDASS